jgi:hypothetical protein
MKDNEPFIERCENCTAYPCISLINLDKEFGNNVYVWAKRITQQVGCIVNKEIVTKAGTK